MPQVETLISAAEDKAAFVRQRDSGGHTLSHWAAKRGDLEILEVLMNHQAPYTEPSEDAVGMCPIHWACTEGRLDVVRFLVDKGVDIDVVDASGCTPLLISAQVMLF